MIKDSASPRSIGVLICTYRRVPSLARCLTGLATQQHKPDDVIVVVRESDEPTQRFLAQRPPDCLPLRQVAVGLPGTVQALNAGLAACRTDVLAIADDDTLAHPDWLARIFQHFADDPRLGALGGRDRCHDGQRFNESRGAPVGRINWYGRAVGNHHSGYGPVRDVAFLKGANMSFRAAAFTGLRFDARLRGTGAQPYEDQAFSLAVGRAGWRVRYDPAVLVDHYPALTQSARHYSGVEAVVETQGYRDYAFNNVVAYWDGFPAWRRLAFMVWSFLVGSSLLPGLVQALRFTPALGAAAWRRFILTQQGKLAACATLLRKPRSKAPRGRAGRPAAIARNSATAGGGLPE